MGLVFQFGYNIIAAILRGIGDSKATFYFLLIASIINFVLDILFVYNFNMGVAGAAIATDIAQIASCTAAKEFLGWDMDKEFDLYSYCVRNTEHLFVLNYSSIIQSLSSFCLSLGLPATTSTLLRSIVAMLI